MKGLKMQDNTCINDHIESLRVIGDKDSLAFARTIEYMVRTGFDDDEIIGFSRDYHAKYFELQGTCLSETIEIAEKVIMEPLKRETLLEPLLIKIKLAEKGELLYKKNETLLELVRAIIQVVNLYGKRNIPSNNK